MVRTVLRGARGAPVAARIDHELTTAVAVHRLACFVPWIIAAVLALAALPLAELVCAVVWQSEAAAIRAEIGVYGLMTVAPLWHAVRGLLLVDRLSRTGASLRGTVVVTLLGLLPGCYGWLAVCFLVRNYT